MKLMNLLNNSFFLLTSSWCLGLLIEPLLRWRFDYLTIRTNFFSTRRTYEWLGVALLRRVILLASLTLNPKLRQIKARSRTTLQEVRHAMTVSELSHWIGFVLMLIATVAAFTLGSTYSVVLLHLVTNVIGNAYHSLLQQYNKLRLDRLLNRP